MKEFDQFLKLWLLATMKHEYHYSLLTNNGVYSCREPVFKVFTSTIHLNCTFWGGSWIGTIPFRHIPHVNLHHQRKLGETPQMRASHEAALVTYASGVTHRIPEACYWSGYGTWLFGYWHIKFLKDVIGGICAWLGTTQILACPRACDWIPLSVIDACGHLTVTATE